MTPSSAGAMSIISADIEGTMPKLAPKKRAKKAKKDELKINRKTRRSLFGVTSQGRVKGKQHHLTRAEVIEIMLTPK